MRWQISCLKFYEVFSELKHEDAPSAPLFETHSQIIPDCPNFAGIRALQTKLFTPLHCVNRSIIHPNLHH